MPKWQFTLNGSPAVGIYDTKFPLFDDGFGTITRDDPSFQKAEMRAADMLKRCVCEGSIIAWHEIGWRKSK
jgi:hypothetical protein